MYISQRLVREIKIWSKLDHPHILPLLGFYASPPFGSALLVTPLAPLGSVEDYMKTNDLSEGQRLKYVDICVHAEANLVHY